MSCIGVKRQRRSLILFDTRCAVRTRVVACYLLTYCACPEIKLLPACASGVFTLFSVSPLLKRSSWSCCAQWSAVLVTIGSSPARRLASLSLVATVLWLRSRNRLRETVQWLLTGRGGHLLSTVSRGRRDRRATRTPTGRMSWAPGTDAPRLHLLSTVDRTGGDGSPLVGSTDSGGPLSPSDRAVGQAGRSR